MSAHKDITNVLHVFVLRLTSIRPDLKIEDINRYINMVSSETRVGKKVVIMTLISKAQKGDKMPWEKETPRPLPGYRKILTDEEIDREGELYLKLMPCLRKTQTGKIVHGFPIENRTPTFEEFLGKNSTNLSRGGNRYTL